MSEYVVEARSLWRVFESGSNLIEVLKGVDLALRAGTSVSIQGESGCGKSTLLHLLAGLDRPNKGSLFWESRAIDGLSGDALASIRGSLIGMVFQSYYLVPELRALENVMLGGMVSGKRTDLRERSEALLERVGLSERMSSLPSTLSGGERQRVAIARAMISEPKVLLADEPTGNLDETTGDAVMEMLQGLCRDSEVALVLVTHNAQHAARMDESWQLRHGVLEKS